MTQHEYVFVAISVILGLAITRLLSAVANLIRAHKRVVFHWSTAVWGLSVMFYILQLWWVGWDLRTVSQWTIVDFFVLVMGSIFVFFAAELALPCEDYDVSDDSELDFLQHGQSYGRISALSMLGYFCVGPFVNITMLGNPPLASILFPLVGIGLVLAITMKPAWFKPLVAVFAIYTVMILYLTA